MNTPPIVSAQEWEAAYQEMLVKEKELTRARDALAAMRRRMPWTPVEKQYEFEGPEGKVSLLDLFDGRRQLIVYRAFVDPGVHGWPEHGCVGCSLMADHIGNLAHLNARDTTLVYASRGSQADIAADEGADGLEPPLVHHVQPTTSTSTSAWTNGTAPTRSSATATRVPHLLHQQPRRRGVRQHLELPRHDRAWAPGGLGGLPARATRRPSRTNGGAGTTNTANASRRGGSANPTPMTRTTNGRRAGRRGVVVVVGRRCT